MRGTRAVRRVTAALAVALAAGPVLATSAHAAGSPAAFRLRNTGFGTCAQVDASVQSNPQLRHRLGLAACDSHQAGQAFLLGMDGTIRSVAAPGECLTFLPEEWAGRDFLAARTCTVGDVNQMWAYAPVATGGGHLRLLSGANVAMEGLRPDGPVRPTTLTDGPAQVWTLERI